MPEDRQIVWTSVGLALLALAHAVLTWAPTATAALFLGGAVVAFVAEVLAVRTGWLDHHVEPQVLGVPPYVLAGWTAVIYGATRLALLAVDGWLAVPIAAVLATGYDVLSDNYGVAEGYWTYDEAVPGPWHGDVPWLNYAGWLVVSGLTAGLAVWIL